MAGIVRSGVRSTEADAVEARIEVIRHIQLGDLLDWDAARDAFAASRTLTLGDALQRYLAENRAEERFRPRP